MDIKFKKNDLTKIRKNNNVKWIHNNYFKYLGKVSHSRIEKSVKVLEVTENTIKTEFGTYFIDSGENIFKPCGCDRFCDCFGKIINIED